MSDFSGEKDFLAFVRDKQVADQEIAKSLVDQAEEIVMKSLIEEHGEEYLEKASSWTDAVEGDFGEGISVYKHGDGSTFWVTKGDAIVGWVEKRGRKWLARPVGREEWEGDDLKSAVSQIVSPMAKDDVAPPPGTE